MSATDRPTKKRLDGFVCTGPQRGVLAPQSVGAAFPDDVGPCWSRITSFSLLHVDFETFNSSSLECNLLAGRYGRLVAFSS